MDIKELYKLYQQHPQITTDSRDCPEGSIFLALKGASFDGNQYAMQALEKGCAYAIIDDPTMNLGDSRLILVDDCLQTFKDLAREHRRQFDIPVIGITGTNGKTTTKELIRAVLSECYNVMATEGNFNNDVGVPKTLFRLNESHDIAVVEMGASHPGDIKTLVETAEPNSGLITNVGRAHLQGFGSFDNEYLMQMVSQRLTANGQKPDIYYYGQSDSEDILIRGEVVSCAPFLKFRWREQDADAGYTSDWMEVQTHLIGAYNLDNMLAAITIGYVNNIPFDKINHALENYVPTNNRSQLTETEKNHLIVDAYNANPTSMKAAIDNFRMMEVSPKMAILGMMGELGDVSQEEHQKIIALLEETRFDEVWLVGSEFQKAHSPFRTFANVDEVKAAIAQEQPIGRYILFQLPELL